ncbi:hypothetical protein ID866_8590 [Astraeus odoratus]|nr:hypothetical protein ID866_8590 [Astraeus odoratus]
MCTMRMCFHCWGSLLSFIPTFQLSLHGWRKEMHMIMSKTN